MAEDEGGLRDRKNCHIILAAKTAKGIGDINEVISEANITGYYYRPRVDMELLMRLDPKDVFVTTACIAGVWAYGYSADKEAGTWKCDWNEPDRIVRQLHSHFGDSFMLEVQPHHTEKQKTLNTHILDIYRKEGIPIIAGMDSHYILPEDKALRDMRLEANHLKYDDEEGWFMDYPSDEEVFRRFEEQGVLSSAQIQEALDNTNVFLEFEDVEFDKGKKLPTIYPNLTQEERNEKYRQLVLSKWDEYKKNVPQDKWSEYEAGIKYEMDVITSTNTSDYFLLDYEIVKKAKENGGQLTYTGRGSGPSFYTNSLLGFSSIDRFALPVTMYPDRFISADRLKAGSLPDLDLNEGNVEVFADAQQQVMGEWHAAPMVAYGTLKRLAAWKMYCRAANVPFDVANELSENLKSYELDYKHADDDEKDEINVLDYVPEKYHEYLKASEKYLGMIDSISPHPCAYLICNQDIRREVGIFRINSKTSKKKVVYAAFIDGATADAYGYLKNDHLAVSVVRLNADIYKRIGIPQPSVPELLKMTEGDGLTWDMYAKGWTLGLNQAEKEKSTEKVMRYKPKNISELSAFVAGIRPACQSIAPKLFGRERFSYGIDALDNLLRTKEMPDSFILYQEQMMKVLQWGGFTPSESYATIKAIAKKHPEKVLPLKERFLMAFKKRLVEEEGASEEIADATSDKVWTIISDACSYLFNASHAVSVALDSLYTAWAKAHHPYETYVSLLSLYSERKDKDRIAKAKEEMFKAFGIRIVPCKFRQDNRSYFVDKEARTISDALTSVKGISAGVASKLYQMRNNQYDSAIDLFYDLEMNTSINSAVVKTLIQMGYFEEFGSDGKLLTLYDEFRKGDNRFSKTLIKKSQEKRLDSLRFIESVTPESDIPMADKYAFEVEYLGTPLSLYPSAKVYYVATDVDDKYSPKIKFFNAARGTTGIMKVRKPYFQSKPIEVGNVVKLNSWERKPAYQYVDGQRKVRPGVFDIWMKEYEIIPRSDEKVL